LVVTPVNNCNNISNTSFWPILKAFHIFILVERFTNRLKSFTQNYLLQKFTNKQFKIFDDVVVASNLDYYFYAKTKDGKFMREHENSRWRSFLYSVKKSSILRHL
jgi:hypothetical protein